MTTNINNHNITDAQYDQLIEFLIDWQNFNKKWSPPKISALFNISRALLAYHKKQRRAK